MKTIVTDVGLSTIVNSADGPLSMYFADFLMVLVKVRSVSPLPTDVVPADVTQPKTWSSNPAV